ncbi:hypothetical protein C8A00DRAFT_42734 [Chaetomidium leptoderma]|uniref:Protein disulfide-isomerase n=1 Tax=Chaetomidium leptoderma TaxID=669021 RepID=A0AAN6VNP5_9PEZI|nr:hypothetical protein C8A00DRAFT_42734 [Chaetomidium leptoderma]
MKFNHFAPVSLLVSTSTAWNHVAGKEFLDQKSSERALIACTRGSQALEKEWIAVQETERDRVVSIDCSAEAELCQRSGVSSFPSIRLYHPDGKQTRYRGPRKAAAVKGFLRRTGRPAVSSVTDKNATAFQSIDDVVLIGHFGLRDAHLRQHFTTTAERYHDRYSFALAGAQQGPRVDCYNNLDGLQRSMTEFPSPGSIESFVKLCSTPLIPELTRRNELSFYESRKSIVHYFVRNDKEREEYVAEMRPLARKYEEYLHFVTTDANEYSDAAEMMGVKRGSKGLSVQNPNNGDLFPYTRKETLTAGGVEAFLGDIIQGKVQPWRPDVGHDEL